MNIITIMNYNSIDSNNTKMCKIFISQIVKHNPECNLYILYETNLAPEIVSHADRFNNVTLLKRPGSSDCWSNHHNLRYKLFNLTHFKEPFIFLDCDIFCLSSLDHLWSRKDDQPFIGVNHQNIPGHTSHIGFKFLNSGVQVVGDPEWYKYNNFRVLSKSRNGNMSCPGWDQAHIFRYCESIGYDYTHPEVGYGWNSCAKYGKIQKTGDNWTCKYTGPSYPGEDKTYDVHLNHYWWNFKPWQIDCPIFAEYE